MKTINTIVLDMDGTLSNSKGALSEHTKEVLIRAQEKGYKVVLASGRPTNGVTHIAHELEMDKHHGYIVSFNGSCVIDVQSGEILYNQMIDEDIKYKLFKHLENFEVIPMVTDATHMYVKDVYDAMITVGSAKTNIVKDEARSGFFKLHEVDSYAEEINFPVNKILIAAEPVYLEANYKEIMDPFKDDLHCVFSAPFYFEFTDEGVDKARALEHVLHEHGIHQENIIAFGDGHNDVSMIRYAGKGVAMANAQAALKDVADLHTKSNDEDGIAHILETVLNI